MTHILKTLTVAGAALAASSAAIADGAGSASSWNQPYGSYNGAENRPYEAGTRDANGNRVIVNGRILTDTSTLPYGIGGTNGQLSGTGSSTAIGNQLNVITTGNWNTVIVNSTQINNGNVTATTQAAQADTELNGEIHLDD